MTMIGRTVKTRTGLPLALCLALAAALLPFHTQAADEDGRKAVEKALVERTRTFCEAVLPAWFASERGTADPDVRAIIADCFTGHARLAILGMDEGLPLEDTALFELPSMLLREAYGMDLDVYRPLAGREIKTRGR